jgi:tetraacyldisaccharide 4'-kinase
VVLIDATNPWGFGFLLPRGLLREPAGELRRAGAVIISRSDQVEHEARARLRRQVERLAPAATVAETSHEPVELINSDGARLPLDGFARGPAAGFCGIGNPDAFQRTLADQGFDVRAFRTFPDHHAYTRADVEELRLWAGQQSMDCVLLTTQKDLVKIRLPRLAGRPLWALRIGLHFQAGQEALDRKLIEVL